MRLNKWMATAGGALVAGAVAIASQQGGQQPAAPAAADPVQILVDRLDLARYKATIKGLTQFGDRREGTAAQPRCGRLDRGAAEKLRLRDRTHDL
jgi:hypothetical protein